MKRHKSLRRVLRMRALRRQREMTQAELARRVGMNTSTICMIELGHRQPSFESARLIAQVFGVPVEHLFEEVEVPA